jgi:hypothetical protein
MNPSEEASLLLDELTLDDVTEELVNSLSENQLLELRRKINPYGLIDEGANKYVNLCYTNVRDIHMKRLLMTTMIGYLNKACDEWLVPDTLPVVSVTDYLNNPDVLNEPLKISGISPEIKKEFEEIVEENKKNMEKRVIIKEFLEDLF